MKKGYLFLGAYGLVTAVLATKLLRRPHDVVWARHARELHHAEYSYFAVVDGTRIHYQEAGPENGPVVFLIHGFCASNLIWSEVFLGIAAAGYRVIAPDLIGFGFSEKPGNAEYTIEMQARMIVRLMDELGIERASLVGSSYGGAVAAFCALDYSDRVEKLCLVDAVINNHAKNQVLLRLAVSPVVGDLVSPFLLDSHSLMRWRLSRIYAPENSHLMTPERMSAYHRPLRTASTHRAVLKTLRRWQAGRVENEASRIKQPTMLIWGEGDADIPVEHGWRLLRKIPNSRLMVFQHCGHLPQEEYPREFTNLVTKFLAEDKRDEDVLMPFASDGLRLSSGGEVLELDRPIG
jgi:pimeloyl-ACP methyl ester carboxylesterase